jgi:acetyl esterase/lipase
MMVVAWMYTTRQRDIQYTGEDTQVSLHLDIVTNRWHRKDARKPVVIYIHGGGWMFGTRDDNFILDRLPATLGWVCVDIDYRYVLPPCD